MSTVAEIKEAIAKLSPREYCELLAELVPHTDDEWDRQMKVDAESGRLDFIDRNVHDAVSKGTTLPLEAGFEKEA
ncbi:MAG: hypothetical protein WCD79_04825 [Chthoniobacteraceae bacterium]